MTKNDFFFFFTHSSLILIPSIHNTNKEHMNGKYLALLFLRYFFFQPANYNMHQSMKKPQSSKCGRMLPEHTTHTRCINSVMHTKHRLPPILLLPSPLRVYNFSWYRYDTIPHGNCDSKTLSLELCWRYAAVTLS